MMKKHLSSLAFFLVCLLLLNTVAFAADSISPQSSAYIFGTHANMTAESNGNMKISFWVSSPAGMTKLGASSIDIYENNGQTTKWVKTIYATDEGYEHMMGSGTYHGSNVTYKGTIGYKYSAKVHLTASDNTGGDTITRTSPEVTAKK